jgi:hypothetical protein
MTRAGYPLVIRGKSSHVNTGRTPSILNKGELDGADDSFLKVSRICCMIMMNIWCILFVDLFMELTNDGGLSAVGECDTQKERWKRAHGSALAVTCSVLESIKVGGAGSLRSICISPAAGERAVSFVWSHEGHVGSLLRGQWV